MDKDNKCACKNVEPGGITYVTGGNNCIECGREIIQPQEEEAEKILAKTFLEFAEYFDRCQRGEIIYDQNWFRNRKKLQEIAGVKEDTYIFGRDKPKE